MKNEKEMRNMIGKKVFDVKYKEYKQLDEQLAALTKAFETLEQKYHAASEQSRAAVAAELLRLHEQKKGELESKSQQYRKLHLELKALKEAVTEFVNKVNNAAAR